MLHVGVRGIHLEQALQRRHREVFAACLFVELGELQVEGLWRSALPGCRSPGPEPGPRPRGTARPADARPQGSAGGGLAPRPLLGSGAPQDGHLVASGGLSSRQLGHCAKSISPPSRGVSNAVRNQRAARSLQLRHRRAPCGHVTLEPPSRQEMSGAGELAALASPMIKQTPIRKIRGPAGSGNGAFPQVLPCAARRRALSRRACGNTSSTLSRRRSPDSSKDPLFCKENPLLSRTAILRSPCPLRSVPQPLF